MFSAVVEFDTVESFWVIIHPSPARDDVYVPGCVRSENSTSLPARLRVTLPAYLRALYLSSLPFSGQ